MALFLPDLILKDVTEIDASLMQKYNIKALILDVDNTLTTHGSQQVQLEVVDWLEIMKKCGIPMMIVSNNTKERIHPFATRLGLDYVSMGCKPLTRGFSLAQKKFAIPSSQIAVIGDQIYTDIMGGNLKGCFTILVSPFQLENNTFFKIKRKLEQGHIKRYHKRNNG